MFTYHIKSVKIFDMNPPSFKISNTKKEIEDFKVETKNYNCSGCLNHCSLTLNKFSNGKNYISGNKCEKPLGIKASRKGKNIYELNREILSSLKPKENARRGTIAIPLVLNM